jgi:hypothetical protein
MRTVLARFLRFLFLVTVALLGTVAAAAPEAVLGFDAETPITLGPKPVLVNVFSSSPQALRSLTVTAFRDPPALRPSQPPRRVAVQANTGTGFRRRHEDLTLPAAGRIRIRLVRPPAARSDATNRLTVTGRARAGVVVARRAVAVESATLRAAVTTWMMTSYQQYPWSHEGGDFASELPLATACKQTEGPTGYVVDRDEAIVVSSTCTNRKLRLHADGYLRPGTYSGKLHVGPTTVELEIRRTMTVWWPVGMIVLGVLLALWTQGKLDSALRTGQWLAIRRLPRRATRADNAYAERAEGRPWERYELEQPVRDAAAALSRKQDEIRQGLWPPFRWLPWPDGYMAEEQQALRTGLATLDQLVSDWPSLPDDFAAANDALMKRPAAAEYAPELVARALIVLGAAAGPFDARELEARRDEARALPGALRVIDELLRVHDYLKNFDPPPAGWAAGDLAALVQAQQYEREAAAMLAAASDATLVKPEVGPVLQRGSRLASRLPPAGQKRGISVAQPQTAASTASVPIVSLGQLVETIQAAAVMAGPAAVIILSLAIGILTGLGLLYNGKAWGAPEDYAAALVWGYVASTITSPIVAVVKHVGTRPRDAAAPAPGG